MEVTQKWETKLTTVFCFKTVEIVANNSDCYEQTKPSNRKLERSTSNKNLLSENVKAL